ncbi:hypothetical protein F5Y16DRAFT_393976 [Xylariaceae sp. FL0255]|nr:hypothetical protein F5Y16DRAFT_393976 [Xylariaceae sp. FL0255]
MALLKLGAHLLKSGDYSDFEPICEGQSFPVHKAIICPQSPIFKKAVDNACLTFMYTQDYKHHPPTGSSDAQKSLTTQEAENKPLPDKGEFLIYHARVSCIADYYDVPHLLSKASQRIKSAFDSGAKFTDAFCKVLEEFMDDGGTTLVCHKTIRDIFVEFAAKNVVELVKKKAFEQGGVARDLAADILVRNATGIQKDEAMAKEILAKSKEAEEATAKNFHDIHAILNTTQDCRKRECTRVFGCTIEKPTENGEGKWLLKCTKCGCRQMWDHQRKVAVLAPPPASFRRSAD